MTKMKKVDPLKFALYAQLSQDLWSLLIGQNVNHHKYGDGIISDVIFNPGKDIVIVIIFQEDDDPSGYRFPTSVCKDLAEFELPDDHPIHSLLIDQPAPKKDSHSQKFKVNDDVSVVNNPRQRGMISKTILDHNGKWNYEVYISADNRPVIKESDLKLYAPTTRWGHLEDFLRDLAMAKMKRPMSNALYALYASRTKFEVYQFKPALKFLSNPDQRLLIADEVGLGKTIEAGIIYLELQARIGLERVLIVCPSSLKQKWQSEMKSRFDEEFVIWDTEGVRSFLSTQNRTGNNSQLRAIVSLESIRRREISEQFADIKFDLVVIDEAHHCRNTGTLTNAIASTLIDNSDAALLLTATPLQMGKADLFNLLKILSPGEFDNFEAFAERLEPNIYINKAAEYLAHKKLKEALAELRCVESTSEKNRFLGNPYYHTVIKILESQHQTNQELVTAQRRLLELNTLASIFTRTRKRDVQEKAPIRTAYTLTVNFSTEEEKFYNEVVEEVRQNFEMSHYSGRGSGWVTIMKERQAASCISALINKMDSAWNEAEASFENEFSPLELIDSSDDDWDDEVMTATKVRARWVIPKPKLKTDSKFDVFWGALKKILEDDPKSKILVFSFFVGTIEHIGMELKKRNVNVSTMHGGFAVSERQKTIEAFRDNPSIRVLVSSDVGSEGLDFQFCDTLFNYDLPWNPMKVEQRIGRIDRFGQESDRIRIYNLVIENSIESRILARLYDRIEIFKHSIGDIEVILGQQIRELTQAVFSNRLTASEEIKRAEDAANIVMRQKQEMEEFEEKKMQFLGQEAILSTAVNQTIASGRYISDIEVQALVIGYVKEKFKHSRIERNGKNDATFTLYVNEDLAHEVKTYIYGNKKNDRTGQQFIPKLVAGKEIPLTFDHELAYKRKLLEFITPRHPFAQAALEYWKEKISESNLIYRINFQTDIAPKGKYYFFIYSMNTEGIDSDMHIIPVVISAKNGDKHNHLSEQFLRLTQTSGLLRNIVTTQYDEAELSVEQDNAFKHMTIIRDRLSAELTASNDAIVNARLTGVEQSYQAKKRHLTEILTKVSHFSIQRMYEGQIRNLEAKKQAKELEIEKGRQLHVNFSLQLQGFVDVTDGL